MKLFTIIILLTAFTVYPQAAKDSIFIEFRQGEDIIKSDNSIWLKNTLYEREMEVYKNLLKTYDTCTDLGKRKPIRPVEYYKFFIIEKLDCSEIKVKTILNRNELSKITQPHKKLIFLIMNTNDTLQFYKISFYENAME